MLPETYSIGLMLGQFFAGAITGIIPMILFFLGKRWLYGIFSVIACGVCAFIHLLASVACGVILLIIAIVVLITGIKKS